STDVLQGGALTRWSALVVQHAHRRAIVHECVEQDRPGVRDDAVAVLQEHRKRLEIRKARLLHRDAFPRQAGGEALAPLAVTRMRAEQQREPPPLVALLPPGDQALDELRLVGGIRRRVAHDEDDGALGIEAELTDDVLVLGARPAPVEDVRLRPTGDDDALRIDAVIASEILSHHLVLDDVAAQVRCDDSLAYGVVPTRDVSDDRGAEPSGTDDEGADGV